MQPTSQGFTRREIAIIGALLLGVLVALASSAVRRSRQSGQDSVVLCNLRQLSAAADQYYLENNVTSVRLTDLVGPTAYLKDLAKIDGETYPARYFKGVTITASGIGGARTVTYAP